jgi:pyruvate,water dikinase
MKKTANILWLGESGARDLSLVGGKATNLSLLADNHPVPPGFCLTTGAFGLWRRAGFPSGLRSELVEA